MLHTSLGQKLSWAPLFMVFWSTLKPPLQYRWCCFIGPNWKASYIPQWEAKPLEAPMAMPWTDSFIDLHYLHEELSRLRSLAPICQASPLLPPWSPLNKYFAKIWLGHRKSKVSFGICVFYQRRQYAESAVLLTCLHCDIQGLQPSQLGAVPNENYSDIITPLTALIIKGIFSDSNNTFFWHKSEDINKKGLFQTIQLIPILCVQVMHDYVFHCSHRLLCWIKSRVRDFLWKLLSFHNEMIPA